MHKYELTILIRALNLCSDKPEQIVLLSATSWSGDKCVPAAQWWGPLLQCIGLILLSGEIRLCCRAASLAPDTVWREAGIPTRLDIECVLPHRPRPPSPRPRVDPQRSEGGLQIYNNNGQFHPTNTTCIQLTDIIVTLLCHYVSQMLRYVCCFNLSSQMFLQYSIGTKDVNFPPLNYSLVQQGSWQQYRCLSCYIVYQLNI